MPSCRCSALSRQRGAPAAPRRRYRMLPPFAKKLTAPRRRPETRPARIGCAVVQSFFSTAPENAEQTGAVCRAYFMSNEVVDSDEEI